MKKLQSISTLLIAAVITAMLSACAPTATTESTGNYIDDTVISTKIKTALFEEKNLKSNDINVETYKGRVQLSGFARSPEEVRQAIQIARSIPGVKTVINSIKLR
ncbi:MULTISPECIES: BON domain-containing protein [Xenorhabdus]|uniref:BON domain-containing protein n=1 Tax=Xenorhabdus TaxID=626 RepID=UPI000C03FF31|nr:MULTISPECIES: BON domain-containing protein [unclassified Xenorhabdus]MCC8366087.1 BON domain-containing protein [Xenorhabdus sp. PB61.4]MCC8378697.1 BON domain-containing protein [Xenorhabdus sp. PB30.3]PHM51316.1 BON domain-containing protein [Xenorhabdus sp. KK7.4]